jgi:hypothetical protein
MRLCELTVQRGRPEVVLALFGNLQRFQISTYFAKEAISKLAPMGVPAAVLLRVAELCKMQRGPSDKGVRSAYAVVVSVLQSRGLQGDADLLGKAQADRRALFAAPSMPAASAGSAPAPEQVVPAVTQQVDMAVIS